LPARAGPCTGGTPLPNRCNLWTYYQIAANKTATAPVTDCFGLLSRVFRTAFSERCFQNGKATAGGRAVCPAGGCGFDEGSDVL